MNEYPNIGGIKKTKIKKEVSANYRINIKKAA
ncbi:MAG: hypothetical protein UR69_C0004G0101 [Candidatus Moranbacteria bacterium GW2011_GWE2_35_2-]|nr:MAG: hypothetical protein UR69_C0004G0101 [Candidatus Moranbacteria bacterium GW2011_GWE2_35_2-]KKQ06182.1 MAG: hypothetical protein US15_C0016G0003 [Candidatus Moranbacteria bacterium GW2011_GWF1_36_4]KKQ22275.1 MAG: hypothetical protein US37_C0003G0101 [Candidatus Moranbacteria bacterium GW2011_GWF2_37_11]KKQ28503.1 MAG: hypothetical protein US44_C0010G0009 [Candidatus Moranbacteria bacterium GW2011_GWD1_37_17]KKQ30233.1 MAG: hypothetical protein US47_C0003G0028 [Candidatus Moranbacteria b